MCSVCMYECICTSYAVTYTSVYTIYSVREIYVVHT